METENKVFLKVTEEHNYNKKYEERSAVFNTVDGVTKSYISTKPVPQFTSVLDKRYWKEISSENSPEISYNVTNIPTTLSLEKNVTYDLGKILKPITIDNSNLDGEAVIKFNYAYENQFPTLPSNLVWEGSEPVFERFSNIEITINGNRASARIYPYDGDDMTFNLTMVGQNSTNTTRMSFYINVSLDELKYVLGEAFYNIEYYNRFDRLVPTFLDFSKSYDVVYSATKTITLSGEILNPKDYPVCIPKCESEGEKKSSMSIGYPIKYSYTVRELFGSVGGNNDVLYVQYQSSLNRNGNWMQNPTIHPGNYILYVRQASSFTEDIIMTIDYPSDYHKDILLYNGQNIDLGDLDYTVVVTNKRLKGIATVSFNCVDATKIPTFEGIVSWEDGAPTFSPYYRYVITVNGQYASYVKYPRIVEQVMVLPVLTQSGYNNIGLEIDISLDELKRQLVEQLGNNIETIKVKKYSDTDIITEYNNGVWSGELTEINPLDYVIFKYKGNNLTEAFNLHLIGTAINEEGKTITIKSNDTTYFTYRGQTHNIGEVFTSSAANDIFKDIQEFNTSIYYEGYGWLPDAQIIKNHLIQYQSNNSEDVVITFD